MLIVFSGLPGVGKTTIARAFAARRPSTYLRIDTIEQSIRDAKVLAADVGTAGYSVAFALAEANLSFGRIVVVDCVNPVAASRAAWRTTAARANASIVDVEIICSDLLEHQRRVEARSSDIPGLAAPTWVSVQQHEYEPWWTKRLVIDTAVVSVDHAISMLDAYLGGQALNMTEVQPFGTSLSNT